MTNQVDNRLTNAPNEIKLAVDLIYLLETNNVDPKVALQALHIVQEDIKRKIKMADAEGGACISEQGN